MGKKILTNVIIPLCCIVLLGLYAVNANNLTNTKSQLDATQIELTTAQADASLTKTNLRYTEMELSSVQSDLLETTIALGVKSELLEATNTILTQTKAAYGEAMEAIDEIQSLVTEWQTTYENLQANYRSLTTGYGYVMRDPTYAQMTALLTADNTDLNPYVDDLYVCEDFANDVITHAMQMKYRCAFVSIRYPDSAHAIIAFNTTDRGLIFIEPQSDEQVSLVVGRHFWQSITTQPGYYYTAPDYDDTVVRFNVIW